MAENSGIEWTDHTFNPWEGCTKISPACDNCYAAARAERFGTVVWGGPRRRTSEANWNKPLKWEKNADSFLEENGRRQRVFCASLADVFDNQVPEEWRADLWDLIRKCPSLDWLLLTKRPQNIEGMLPPFWDEIKGRIWLGTTVENQAIADRNIPHLLKHDAAVRFLSCEPLLGPIDLWHKDIGGTLWIGYQRGCGGMHKHGGKAGEIIHGEKHRGDPHFLHHHHDNRCRRGLDWVIAGGESGSYARPSREQWFVDLMMQCRRASTPFLFKQWGEYVPADMTDKAAKDAHPKDMILVGKKNAGRLLLGREHTDFPDSPEDPYV